MFIRFSSFCNLSSLVLWPPPPPQADHSKAVEARADFQAEKARLEQHAADLAASLSNSSEAASRQAVANEDSRVALRNSENDVARLQAELRVREEAHLTKEQMWAEAQKLESEERRRQEEKQAESVAEVIRLRTGEALDRARIAEDRAARAEDGRLEERRRVRDLEAEMARLRHQSEEESREQRRKHDEEARRDQEERDRLARKSKEESEAILAAAKAIQEGQETERRERRMVGNPGVIMSIKYIIFWWTIDITWY